MPQERAPVIHQQLLILQRMATHPNANAFTIAMSLVLRGDLRPVALRAALDRLVARHHALHSRFVDDGDQWWQEVDQPRPAELEMVDLSALDPQARTTGCAELVRELAHRPFDLAEGHLMRFRLIRLGADHWRLVLAYHHVIMDGWALHVLLDELSALYTAEVTGAPAELVAEPDQCTDYARWQSGLRTPERLDEDLRYWLAELAGSDPRLELPADFPTATARRPGPGRKHEFDLPEATVEALRKVVLEAGVTLFVGLAATLATQLWRLTGSRDLLLSIPFLSRSPEYERVVTCMASPVLLRCQIDPDESFLTLTERLGDRFFEAVERFSVSFPRLLDALVAEGGWRHRGPASVALVMQDYLLERSLAMPGLDLSVEYEWLDEVAHTDLVVNLVPDGAALHGIAVYNADLFRPDTVERWASQLAETMARVAEQSQTPLTTLFAAGLVAR